jgi:hypothetical protein
MKTFLKKLIGNSLMPMHNWSLLAKSFLPVPPKLPVCMYNYYMYYWYCGNDQQVMGIAK